MRGMLTFPYPSILSVRFSKNYPSSCVWQLFPWCNMRPLRWRVPNSLYLLMTLQPALKLPHCLRDPRLKVHVTTSLSTCRPTCTWHRPLLQHNRTQRTPERCCVAPQATSCLTPFRGGPWADEIVPKTALARILWLAMSVWSCIIVATTKSGWWCS